MVGIPNTKGFIVDGFPRELEQGKEFENEVSRLHLFSQSCEITLNYTIACRTLLDILPRQICDTTCTGQIASEFSRYRNRCEK